MKNLQAVAEVRIDSDRRKVADDVAKLIAPGFSDSDFLKIATMLWKQVRRETGNDAVYTEFPSLTQFVTEEHFNLGTSESLELK
jgi:hypothetical protein